ncbi:MAG TPA: hypothetical protein VF995_07695, partial [Actinomycetota bacterium]
MLEHHVRARVAGLPNVALRHGHVEDVLAGRGARSAAVTVTGVRLAGDERLHADLVVDASGRAARSLRWLERLGLGCVAPPLSAVHVDMGYATRILRRDPGDGRDWRVAIVIGDPPSSAGVAFALEDEQWMVTLAGFHGDHPPTTASGWAEFAATLPDPAIAELIAESEPLSAIVPHRMAASLRRHVERLHQRQLAGGLVLLGDAVASFNPIYGQGISAAALQAEALATALDRCDGLGAGFVRTYNRLAGRAVAAPWRLSVGGDFALPQTTGAKPWGTALTTSYLRRTLQAAQHDEVVAQRLVEVTHLLRPPSALLAPAVALRVRTAWGVICDCQRSPAPVSDDQRCSFRLSYLPATLANMRSRAAPFVAAPPTGARIRTRLRVEEPDAQVLWLVGTHLGRLASLDLAVRCQLGADDDQRTERQRALTAASSSRW